MFSDFIQTELRAFTWKYAVYVKKVPHYLNEDNSYGAKNYIWRVFKMKQSPSSELESSKFYFIRSFTRPVDKLTDSLINFQI